MANIYDMSDTWNEGGTTFTGIGLNVTDTASGASSLLMDLQVGGVTLFSVDKHGAATSRQIGGNGGGFLAGGAAITNARMYAGQYGVRLSSNLALSWSSGVNLNTLDVNLSRDAANTLGQRNSTNAQTFNLYNTYTDASNYERGVFDFNIVANNLTIGTTKAGTGATRALRFVVGGSRVAISDGTYFQIDKDLYPTENIIMAAKYTEMAEMTAPAAPATNKVRIYAEDDGAGKTRLMALFPTGAAQQIAIEP